MDRYFVRNDEGYSPAECVPRECIMSGVGTVQELLRVWDIPLSLSLLVCFLFSVFLCDFWFSTVKWFSCFFCPCTCFLHSEFYYYSFLLLLLLLSLRICFWSYLYIIFFVALVFQTCFVDYLLPIQILSCKQGSSSTSSLTPFTSWVLPPSLNCQLNKDTSLIARETDRHRQSVLHKFLCTI
jgi:hypothetical protein